MKNPFWTLSFLFLFGLASAQAQSRVPGHNSTHSNKTTGISENNNWLLSFTPSGSFPLRSNEAGLFRGNGWGSQLQAAWMPGPSGIAISSGFISSGFDQAGIDAFIVRRGFTPGSPVTSSNPLQAYLLAGPVLQLGEQLRLQAALKGGLFLNNAGSLLIGRQGALVPFYRFESSGSGIRPGWSGSLGLSYPLNGSSSLQLGGEWLQSQTPILLFDPQQGVDIPRRENRKTGSLNIGISLVKTLGSRVAIKTKATGAEPVRISGIVSQSETDYPGTPATGKLLPPANAVAIKTKATGAEPVRLGNTSCGPVTVKETLPDGRVKETTFACPEDAAAYQRSTVPKQTQGATFGERVNAGIKQSAHLQDGNPEVYLLAGQLRYRAGGGNGIVSNQSIRQAGTAPGRQSGGPLLALFAREGSSGRSASKNNYQILYNEQTGENCGNCAATVAGNPIGGLTIKAGRNTGGDSLKSSRVTGKPNEEECDDISGITVYLRDAVTGVVVASTETDAYGGFWFAGVPGGRFAVELDGIIQVQKSYSFNVNSGISADVGGELVVSGEEIELAIEKVERGKSRSVAPGTGSAGTPKANINTSRSNTKGIVFTGADTDGDGKADRFTANLRLNDGGSQSMDVTQASVTGTATTIKSEFPVATTQKSGINTSRSNVKNASVAFGGNGLEINIQFEDGTTRDVTAWAETEGAPGVWLVSVQLGDSDGDGRPDYVWSPHSSMAVTAARPQVNRGELGEEAENPWVKKLPLYFTGTPERVFTAGNQGGAPLPGAEARPGNPIGGLTIKAGRNPSGEIQTMSRTTNASGEFEWVNLQTGSYTLTTRYQVLIRDVTLVELGSVSGKQ